MVHHKWTTRKHIGSRDTSGMAYQSPPRNLDDSASSSVPDRELANTGSLSRLPRSRTGASYSSDFTLRSLLVGLLVGVLVCFCNVYFGLQTGWGSAMSMPSALVGFAVFRSVSHRLKLPFTPVENVLVQTVAGAAGTMSLECGFVATIPAMEFLLKKTEGAPINLGLGRLIIWSLGVCLFGSVFAVVLRKQVILREQLKFPSGTATAILIRVLHGNVGEKPKRVLDNSTLTEDETYGLLDGSEYDQIGSATYEPSNTHDSTDHYPTGVPLKPQDNLDNARGRYVRLLLQTFTVSAFYTVLSYFVPQIRDLPIFGRYMATNWLWTLNPSPAYLGQGAIIGPTTTLHMLVGAIAGWGVLSPVAKSNGWAPGPIGDWEEGSKGWIMWISLAILLTDSLISLVWLARQLLIKLTLEWMPSFKKHLQDRGRWHKFILLQNIWQRHTAPTEADSPSPNTMPTSRVSLDDSPRYATPQNTVSSNAISILLILALAICVICVNFSFGSYISPTMTILATLLAMIAAVIGVRALGETDLNPTSGLAKLVQLICAVITPKDDPNAVIINLLAGSIAQSGAGQAGDLMQDLKTGHLLDASPTAQFYGQIIGSVFGVVVSPAVYRLYVSIYQPPNQLFQIPGAYIWVFTARLVTGKGLPPMALHFGVYAALIFVPTTVLRIYLGSHSSPKVRQWQRYVPGGTAVAVGIYITPSFSMSIIIGGLLSWSYLRYRKEGETTIIVMASGLILGEGIVSMVNLGLASLHVPHL